MKTITLKINDKSIAGKTFLAFLKTFVAKEKAVEIVEEPKSPYNPKFVEMVNNAEKSKKRYEVKNVDDLWASL
ncbi:MAG: hypothetical protein KF732_12690 [Flavobacteriales bacterium]|nr:hypothetical protein [Flavobacteriales bacterium]MBX2960800.1 hypothetical protein [Flavobacteriales bacterium]MCL4857457.1 hypothetical protein [Flavobacteriales bacterium]